MSVLCCRIPNFLIRLACRGQPELADRPLALLGPDVRVCAASPAARKLGVRAAMPARQALTHCPDLVLQPVENTQYHQEQAAFLGTLTRAGLPVEALDWGAAYIDLHSVATQPKQVQSLAADFGRQVRDVMGRLLQPAIGWDSGKFTARAAALRAPAGKMRLVGKADEITFLAPLPITMLPLPPEALRELHWLGVHTLGQFAAMPPVGVEQRFGKPGRLAQRWAQGRDDRPVRATVPAAPEPLVIDLDPPADSLPSVLTTVMAVLHPHLLAMRERMEGYRHLRLEAHFLDGSDHTVNIACVEPVNRADRVQQALEAHLRTLHWPNAMTRLRIFVLETGELRARQLSLFSDGGAQRTALADLARQLVTRFGPVFLGVAFTDPDHPIPSRRFHLQPLV